MKQEMKKKKGFTLVEMLVVLIIIGVLVALILPNALKAIDSANVRETAATLRNIDTALRLCFSERRVWTQCDSMAELTTAPDLYMDAIPGPDPFNHAYAIVADATGNGFESEKTTHFTAWPDLNSIIR